MKLFRHPAIVGPLLAAHTFVIYAQDSFPAVPTSFPSLTQKLNHNDSNSATFQQLYELNTTFFKPGGPIFYHQGAENPLLPLIASWFGDVAEEFGAIVATIEHRFFGQSFPVGVGPENITTEDYAPLTLENVLLDSISLIKHIKETVPGAEESKVIVTGGSYAGNIAIMLRLRYPEIFDGVLAASPATKSFGPLPDNPYKYEWARTASNQYFDLSAEAASKIKSAFREFDECKGDGCSKLATEFNFCSGAPSNASDWLAVFENLIDLYQYAAQFNLAYGNPSGLPVAWPLQTIVNQTLQANSSGAVLRIPWMIRNWQTPDKCLEWRNNTNSEGYAGDSWKYITCAYMPVTGLAIPEDNMFPPRYTNGLLPVCPKPEWESELYNKTNDELVEFYGFTSEKIEKAGRIISTEGSYDPTSGLGPPPLKPSSDRNASRTILVTGMAHGEDINSELISPVSPIGGKPVLAEIRNTKKQYLKQWLGLVS